MSSRTVCSFGGCNPSSFRISGADLVTPRSSAFIRCLRRRALSLGWRALTGSVEIIALDLRGFGRSHRPTQDYSIDLWVEDTVRLVGDVGGVSRPVVYGHGLGACIALALAARIELGGLALSGVALSPGEPTALGQLIEIGDRGEVVTGNLEALAGAPAAADDLTPQIVARAARTWQSFDGRRVASGLEAPLLVLAAEARHAHSSRSGGRRRSARGAERRLIRTTAWRARAPGDAAERCC